MRIFIFCLSILIFILSGLITYRALEIPGYNFSYKNKQQQPVPQPLAPAPPDTSDQLLKEQAASNIQVEKLRAEITELENKLTEKNSETAASIRMQETGKKAKVIAVLAGGMFSSGQVVVSKSFTNSMNEVIRAIADSPDEQVVIEGHTDNTPIRPAAGTQYKDNMDLSFLRAKAIADVLVENGISREHISIVGYGDTRPVASNDSDEGKANNRRVEVKLVPGDREF